VPRWPGGLVAKKEQMTRKSKHIAIVGAGLVGSLLSVYLAKRGYQVSVFERRKDPRNDDAGEGRSINLALSTRGILALEEMGLADDMKRMAIPMDGRIMHDTSGHLSFLPYGKTGQYINSISRSGLNGMLIRKAEENNVRFFFGYRCTHVDTEATSITFSRADEAEETLTFDLVAGADGAFSAVRSAMQLTDRYNYSQHYLEHGYKELRIPAGKGGDFQMEKNALHIWPRQSFMMIALPNPDGSFTCTLFLPFEGRLSFASLRDDSQIMNFFSGSFPDAISHMPQLLEDYYDNPMGSLVTIRCFPWTRRNTFLIGDAAHAIVPFYGQGMNAGFEDCRILNELLARHDDDWPAALQAFGSLRKEDGDAIAQLAFDNFIEMRDLVADPSFLLRKKLEAKLHELYPDKWIPLYSMVTFHPQLRYSEAYRMGKKQEHIMDEVMKKPGIAEHWQDLNFREIVEQLS
jgi:kynurenine 3-monooxygenase